MGKYGNQDLRGNKIENAKLTEWAALPTGLGAGDAGTWVLYDGQVNVWSGTAWEVQGSTPSATETLTNKAIDAANNTISNLDLSMFAAGVVDTDLSTVSASDDTVASAKATKAYVDGVVAGINKWAGTHDASGGAVPTVGTGVAGAINAGDAWRVSVAGTITGLGVLTVNDVIFANIDDAAVAADFSAVQANVDAASTTVSGLVELATVAETEAHTDTARAVTPAGLATYARKYTGTITADGTETTYEVTHNLGKPVSELSVVLWDVTAGEYDTVGDDGIAAGTDANNQISITFSPAHAAGNVKVTVIG